MESQIDLTVLDLRKAGKDVCFGCTKLGRLCLAVRDAAIENEVPRQYAMEAVRSYGSNCLREVPFPPPSTESAASCSVIGQDRVCEHDDLVENSGNIDAKALDILLISPYSTE